MGIVNKFRDTFNIRYSKIKDGVLIRLDSRDIRDGVYVVPRDVHTIGEGDGDGVIPQKKNFPLVKIVMPGHVKKISDYAFQNHADEEQSTLECVEMAAVEEIGDHAFVGYKNLKKVVIPATVKTIGWGAFEYCGLEDVEILSKDIKMTECSLYFGDGLKRLCVDGCELVDKFGIIHNFSKCYDFIMYAAKNDKRLPQNEEIMIATNPKEVDCFYKNFKEWQPVAAKFSKQWGQIKEKDEEMFNDAMVTLYKVAIVLGVFQDGISNQVRDKINVILDDLISLPPQELIAEYSDFETYQNGYDAEFARFFLINYEKAKVNNMGNFTHFMDITDGANEVVVRSSGIYNTWDTIRDEFKHKEIMPKREAGSKNNGLTLEDITTYFTCCTFENVHEGCEELAQLMSPLAYNQEQFDEAQKLLEEGKKILQEDMTLKINPDTFDKKGVRYEFLDKSDPYGLVIGNFTNCCQRLGSTGEECVKYGITKPNSGFIKFSLFGEIIGQSWVWYNEKTETVCLDSIEIPTKYKKIFISNEQYNKTFVYCLTRLADGIVQAMKHSGHDVTVVVGGRYTSQNLFAMEKFEKIEGLSNPGLPSDYNDYSDAEETQYIISGVKFEDLYNNENIQEEGVTV